MRRTLLLVVAGGAAVYARPVPNPTATLTPAQIERGCTLDLIPFRRECHAVKNENTTLRHVGDTPAPDPLFDVGCDWNEGAKLPHHCHLGGWEIENPLPDTVRWLRGFPYPDGHPTVPVPTTTTSPVPTSPVPTTTKSPAPTSPVPTTTKSPVPTSPPTTTTSPVPSPTHDPNKNVTDVLDTVRHLRKDNTALKVGLSVGLGVGIPAAAAAGWVAKTLAVARGVPEIGSALAEGLHVNSLASLGEFGLGNIPQLSGSSHPGSSDLSQNPWESVPEEEYYDDVGNVEDWSGPTHNDDSDLSRNPWDSTPEDEVYDEDASELQDGTEHDGYTDSSGEFEDRPDDVTENADERIEDWLDDVEDEYTPRQFENLEDLGEDVTDSVEELENMLREAGYSSEEAGQLMTEFQADLAASSESYMSGTEGAAEGAAEGAGSIFEWVSDTVANVVGGAANAAGGAANAAGGAANAAGGASSAIESFGAGMAADVASSGAGAEAVADALIQAGVPAGSVASTANAITNAIKALPQAGSSNAARNAALNVISKAITPRGEAMSEAASAALGGAPGETVANALREAAVPEDAVGSAVQVVNDAIEGARAAGKTGSKLMTSAIDAISRAFPPDSGETRSGGFSDLADSTREISRALMNVVGTSYNFWHEYPKSIYNILEKLQHKKHPKNSKISKALAKLLANGPPPEMGPYRGLTFPFHPKRIRGNNVKVLPGEGGKTPSTSPSPRASPSPSTSPSQPSKSPSQTGKAEEATGTSTAPPAPPAPTEPTVPRTGYCANLTDEDLASAHHVKVGDKSFQYGGVNKTALARYARGDPAEFATLVNTLDDHFLMCAMQIRLESPTTSGLEKAQAQYIVRLVEDLMSAVSEIRTAGTDSDGLGPAAPDAEEDFNYVLIDVPKLKLPFGRGCHYLDDFAEWSKFGKKESTQKAVRDFNHLLWDVLDFFEDHRDQYLLYMRLHPDELSTAIEALEDTDCNIRGMWEKYSIHDKKPGPHASQNTLPRVQAMLKELRRIQRD